MEGFNGGTNCENENGGREKIYRSLCEAQKRLESLVQGDRIAEVTDLFGPEASLIRLKLRDYSVRLVLEAPLEYGIKSIDVYWRKGFYDTLALAKSFRKGEKWSRIERALLRSHLLNGIGHFHHLLLSLEEFQAKRTIKDFELFDFSVSGAVYGYDNQRGGKNRNLDGDSEKLNTWLRTATYRCLMCLGDLARYLVDFADIDDVEEDDSVEKGANSFAEIARRYYHQALNSLDYQIGLPFNQLGTLAGNDNYGLDAAFLYLRSMTCKENFEGARENLRSLLVKNEKILDNLSENEDDEEPNPEEEMRRCIVFLLHLVYVLTFQEKERKLTLLCQKTLVAFQNCLYLQHHKANDIENGFLISGEPPNVIFSKDVGVKMVALILSLIRVLEEDESKKDEIRISMARAYFLAVFSHFVTKLQIDLCYGLFGPNYEESEAEETTSEPQKTVLQPPLQEDEVKKKKKKKSKLDRFRRKRPNGSSDDENFSDLSEDDDESYSLDESEGSSPEGEGEENDDYDDVEDSYDYSEDDAENDDDDVEDVVFQGYYSDVLSTLDLVKAVQGHNLVPAVRLCCLWFTSSKDLIVKALDKSPAERKQLWDRMERFSGIVSFDNPKYEAQMNITSLIEECSKSSWSFPEDFVIRGMTIEDGPLKSLPPDSLREGVARILQFREFRAWLEKTKEEKPVKSNGVIEAADLDSEVKKEEEIGRPSPIQQNGRREDSASPEPRSKEDREKRAALMQNMAQLWLQQEVKDLEKGDGGGGSGEIGRGGVGRNGMGIYSPYLVIDHFAMARHLKLVKDVVSSKKFAVIIPSAAVQELDSMKTTENGARNAIRWLEKQFQEGNRWLRAQKKNETKPLELFQLPKKKCKEAWNYFRIMECCNYLADTRRGSNNVVTLLTSVPPSKEENKGFSPSGLAQSIGVRVENIDGFSKGNKRYQERRRRRKAPKSKG